VNEHAYRDAETTLWERVGAQPSERRVKLDRLGCTARIQSLGEGRPVVFIHGGPNSGSTWAPLVARLQHLRCIVVDRPGTGLSDPLPEPLRLERVREYSRDLVEDVLDGEGLDRADFVVSSFGGWVALHAAAMVPVRFGRVVQMGCPAMVPGMSTPPFMRMMSLRAVRWLLGALPPSARSARSVMRQIGHGAALGDGRMPDELVEWYVALQRHTDTMANETAMIASAVTLRGFVPEATLSTEVLAGVTAPTALIWGLDDAFGGEDVARALRDSLPDAQLHLLERTGHLPWLDEPARCAELTGHFLARSPSEADAFA
jgi:2-hydroxy-6-oxonona-2,4-dienedioate hydrolase